MRHVDGDVVGVEDAVVDRPDVQRELKLPLLLRGSLVIFPVDRVLKTARDSELLIEKLPPKGMQSRIAAFNFYSVSRQVADYILLATQTMPSGMKPSIT